MKTSLLRRSLLATASAVMLMGTMLPAAQAHGIAAHIDPCRAR
jgi:hypothetical protein